MTLKEAKRIAGSLGYPIKMPGTSYGLPATACRAGAKLAKIAGTVCSDCYALQGRQTWNNPAKAQALRLAAISHPLWVEAMTRMLLHVHRNPTFRIDLGVVNAKARGIARIRYNFAGWHRWHDSGDLQSVEHMRAICDVALRTPKIQHWLPTQELATVAHYLAEGGAIPDNLIVRVSLPMVDDHHARRWPTTSSVFTHDPPAATQSGQRVHVCPSPQQDHKCGDCRACWSKHVAHVAYLKH